jgi:uncharacterized protein (UPF0262 family)
MLAEEAKTQRLVDVRLDEKTLVRRKPEVEHERAIAIYDLLEENYFHPAGDLSGPFTLVIRLEENRLLLIIGDEGGRELTEVVLPLTPFRTIIKDYFLICESYYGAIKRASPSQIEAIDVGRRGLHNEGSALLRERLEGKIAIDHETARRLFTLVCILHIRG